MSHSQKFHPHQSRVFPAECTGDFTNGWHINGVHYQAMASAKPHRHLNPRRWTVRYHDLIKLETQTANHPGQPTPADAFPSLLLVCYFSFYLILLCIENSRNYLIIPPWPQQHCTLYTSTYAGLAFIKAILPLRTFNTWCQQSYLVPPKTRAVSGASQSGKN